MFPELDDMSQVETLAATGFVIYPGAVLGGRYRVRAPLGHGGMGEVWRAFDLKLRVDVALKSLKAECHHDKRALATLRQEVRSAREVVSPHVCRVYDLIEIDGRELVSMEYIDGATLWSLLEERSPLDLVEAREIALQFLAGIEAIHAADLVHRDIKPENVMVTRSGRVVVMDFGIAKGLADGHAGTIAGTPAYMSPEQARGEPATSRADVFSAGVVLAEMIAPGGVRTKETRRRLWEEVRSRPLQLSESPWTAVVERAVRENASERYASASTLARALEEVTLRVAGAESSRPFPGLASFTEEDAEYFFGRELEVEEAWKKLQHTHLMGVIGPSGAGKSSFLRAGLLPVMPAGWSAVIMTPGPQPFKSLAQALIPQLARDTDAMHEILQFEDPEVAISLVAKWRGWHDEALLVVDQFEELFTQNPIEVQERFADLLGRLSLDADVHLVVAMRDDFLFKCQPHEGLRPLLSALTLLGPPTGGALRRAVVQPALQCGYRFDDESLVDEMVAEVTAERGALPLLAFAAARLWDHRNRERGLLTREAYEHIGGVGGALAQHAEATLEEVGHEHLSLVREHFRNLVTADGTRATRGQQELLSVFDPEERQEAERVLAKLVDARLLVTYDKQTDEEESEPTKRIEIIHESLLSNWPRLVRWRTQDADSAQLRDQLRQASRIWVERGRPGDLLWTGTSFREFELWRERYEGGLSEHEEDFAGAMGARAQRRRRQRRLAMASAFGVLLLVLAVVGFFWRQSDAARARAEREALRAEASKLLALGQLELDTDHTAALAYATASLGLADTPEARTFALRALSKGPPARVLEPGEGEARDELYRASFSPDGHWMTYSEHREVWVIRSDGTSHRRVDSFGSAGGYIASAFSADGGELVALKHEGELGEIRIWSVPAFELVHRRRFATERSFWVHDLSPVASGYLALYTTQMNNQVRHGPAIILFSEEGEPTRTIPLPRLAAIDWVGRWFAYVTREDRRSLYVRSVLDWDAPPRRVGRHDENINGIRLDREGGRILARYASGQIRVWPNQDGDPELGAPEVADSGYRLMDGEGAWAPDLGWQRWMGADLVADGIELRVWDLEAPSEALPRTWISPGAFNEMAQPAFSPDGQWITTEHRDGRAVWPLSAPRPTVLAIPEDFDSLDLEVAFTPDGERLVSAARGHLREWDLSRGGVSRILSSGANWSFRGRLAVDPEGRFVVASTTEALVVSFDGSVRSLGETGGRTWPVAVDLDGHRVAASSWDGPREAKAIRVWELDSGEMRALGPVEEAGEGFAGRQNDFAFLPGNRLVSVGDGGLRVWDIEENSSTVLAPSSLESRLAVTGDGRLVAHTHDGQLALTDLESETTRALASHGNNVTAVGVGRTGRIIVSGSADGLVRVGPSTGEEPHLLFGHTGQIKSVAVSPDGRRIASIGFDHTIRLWATPDLASPPLQSLTREELLARLLDFTNVRVFEDAGSGTGWTVGVEAFPGWVDLPNW